jgi:hypothetical protein
MSILALRKNITVAKLWETLEFQKLVGLYILIKSNNMVGPRKILCLFSHQYDGGNYFIIGVRYECLSSLCAVHKHAYKFCFNYIFTYMY